MKEKLRSSVNGKGKRGRKRKRETTQKEDFTDGFDSSDVNDKNVSDSNPVDGLVTAENSTSLSPGQNVEGGSIKCEAPECGENGPTVDGDVRQAVDVASKGKRGRKRKNAEDSCWGQKKGEKVALDGVTQVNGRVLRPRTMANPSGGSDVFDEDFGVEREKKVDKKEIKVEKVEDGSVPTSRRGRKKKKGRRGRPPKINSENGASAVVISKKLHMKKGFKQRVSRNELKTENNIKESKSSEKCKSKAASCDPNKGGTKKGVPKSEPNKEMGVARSEEKQLIREKIVRMLMNAGWTIEYRPRNGREYNDAVYVEPDGKTHWSVTKAYKRLQEKVATEIADDQEVAAYTVMPEELLSKLFRVIGKTRNDFGIPKEKGATKKKQSKNSSSSKTSAESKRGKKLKCCPRPHGAKQRSHPGKSKKQYALLARGSKRGSDSDGEGFELYDGKRTLLSWMIDMGTVPKGGKVQYMDSGKTRVLCEGKLTGDGICCSCCNNMHTVQDFEFHAGSKLGEPFQNIYLPSGPSLLQCLAVSWLKLEKNDNIGFRFVDVVGDDPNDDTCNICGDGGDLICCDGCPSTFHQSCLDIQNFPAGDWCCAFCSCKFCGNIGQDTAQHVDDHDTVAVKLFTCSLCEEKFHIPCVEGKESTDIDFETPSFCGEGCWKILKRLHELLGVRHELEEGFSWTILHRRDFGRDVSCNDERLKIECNSKLAVAYSIMDECFLPIVHERSKTNMIHNVVYNCGSNFRRLDYSGFYTIILERGDEVISAASVRIHGNQLAEMPFIATRYAFRRQGMCRRLLTAIEMVLGFLDVKKLVIPAISQLIETWTKVFGFMPLEGSKRHEMKYMSMIVFPGTDMLQKPVQKHQLTGGIISSVAGSEVVTEGESKTGGRKMDDLPSKSAMNCFVGADSNASAVTKLGKIDEIDASVKSGESVADPSNDASYITNETINSQEPFKGREIIDLNISIDSEDIIVSQALAADSPSVDMQQTADAMKTCPSAQSDPAYGHGNEKTVDGMSVLNEQDSCPEENESRSEKHVSEEVKRVECDPVAGCGDGKIVNGTSALNERDSFPEENESRLEKHASEEGKEVESDPAVDGKIVNDESRMNEQDSCPEENESQGEKHVSEEGKRVESDPAASRGDEKIVNGMSCTNGQHSCPEENESRVEKHVSEEGQKVESDSAAGHSNEMIVNATSLLNERDSCLVENESRGKKQIPEE